MDNEERLKIARKYRRYFEAVIYVDLLRKRKHMPALEIGGDEDVYTNRKAIHLSTGRITYDTDREIFENLFYFLGHELQHIHSTVMKDWKACLSTSERELLNELSIKEFGKPVKLYKESDVEHFYEEMEGRGVYVSRKALTNMIHFVMNSLEDGRIENIRDKKHPGFKKYRRMYRGMLWEKEALTDDNAPLLSGISPGEELEIILNEILTLSTTELYGKGFLNKYAGTYLHDKVRSLIPNIRRAIFAKTCRECMNEAHEIILALSDLIISSAKANEFEKTLIELFKKFMESIESEYNDDPKDEEEGEMPADAPFGTSVLRESPTESDKGEGKGSDEEGSDKEESSDEGSEKGKSSKEKEEDGEDTGTKKNGSKEDSGDEPEDFVPSGSSSHTTSSSEESESEAERMISEAMADEMSKANADLEAAEEDVKKEKEFKDKLSKWESSEAKEIDISDVDALYNNDVEFEETTRDYTPDEMLPFEIENKGLSLKNKIKEVLKNKRLPDRRGLKTGSLDSSKLHKLIFSDTTIFKKRGEEEVPDMAGYILLDNSGSMGFGEGSNRHFACNAVSIIEEGFKSYMPLKISAFDALGYRHVRHEVVKGFDEVSPSNLTHNFLVKGMTGMGNKDGYSIRVATKELLSRNEKDKLLIVVSDGIPTDYTGGYPEGVKDVRSAVEEARRHGIKLIGLFMYSDQSEEDFRMFKEMYKPEYIICEREDMEDELVRVMKTVFLA